MAGRDEAEACFRPLYDWEEPRVCATALSRSPEAGSLSAHGVLTDTRLERLLQDDVLLCKHVAQNGASDWGLMEARHSLPDSVWSLKWHVLLLLHDGSRPSVPKWYSDWELCVLMLVSTKCISLLCLHQLLGSVAGVAAHM